MSVDISIDRRKLLEALLRPYNVIPFMRFSYDESWATDLYYKDGWLFVDLKTSGKYPTIDHGKVHAELPTGGTDGSVMMVYVHELRPYFFHFFETEKAEYGTYLGIDLGSDGSVKYVNNPDGRSQTLLPAGSIKNGDTLVSGLYIWNDGGTKKVRILIRRVDFTNRTFVDLVDFTDTITYNYHVVSAYGPEVKAQPCRFGIAFVATGSIRTYFDIAQWLIKYGLPDPKEINPWK
ncbi:MAG: hypothetical protein QXT64_02745 [Desulfurococcaceae archaeon]